MIIPFIRKHAFRTGSACCFIKINSDLYPQPERNGNVTTDRRRDHAAIDVDCNDDDDDNDGNVDGAHINGILPH